MSEPEILEINRRLVAAIKPGMTAEKCAKACYAVLKKLAVESGQLASEAMLKSPADHWYAGNCWLVAWEAGPYQWAIPASFAVGEKMFCEPYYSFDLCFYDNEGVAK